MQSARNGTDLESIQKLIVARQFDHALGELAELLAADPDNSEALYMGAVCHRYETQYSDALAKLDRLKSIAPEHGRAHQEEGHVHRAMGNLDEACRCYARACQFNPALEASWRGQLAIFEKHKQAAAAERVRAHLDYLNSLPKVLVAVLDLVAQGKLLKAEDLCRQFLRQVPQHVEAMRLLADIGMRLGVLDDAEFLLESAIRFQPDNIAARIDYIRALRKRQNFPKALQEARRLLDGAPDNPQFQSLVAIESMQSGDFETAIRLFDDVLRKIPGDPVTLTSKGHAYKTSGSYDEAVAAYQSAIRSDARHGEAWYALSNLKVYEFGDDEVQSMRSLLSNPNLSHIDRVHVCFALGKAYEDRQQFDASFDYYAQGNALKKVQSRYDSARMSEDLAIQRDVCTAALFERHQGVGCNAPDPIFIVGLPRAGSTLLEQILSSHSQVDGTLELPNILSLSQRLRRRSRHDGAKPYPQILAELSIDELRAFGEEFIRDTRVHRQGAAYFIDKMPNNFRHIGLIQLILPNAKIIDARRHPMACCFSGFKQLFAEGQEFTYDLEDLGQYYRDYVDLMDHWDAVLPGKVFRVQYEDVVSDLVGQVRRLLDYCELPFEDACVDYHRTTRSVRTPSSEQVRQPIFKSGLLQWRKFDAHLDSLKLALGPVLSRYPIK